MLNTLLITSTLAHQINWNKNNSANWCDFYGNDLSNALSKPGDCRELCVNTTDCTHFTWTDFNSGTCWLKTSEVTKSDALSKVDQNALCGIVVESGKKFS